MIYYIIKVVISAGLIVAISEISKKSSLIGGIFASIPLVSVLAMIWLYIDTNNVDKVSKFSTSIFWLVIPSLSLFKVLPFLLKTRLGFYPSLLVSIIVMVCFYYLLIYILSRFGINL